MSSRWHSLYLNLPDDKKAAVLNLAMTKLAENEFNEYKRPNLARLAELDCRVLLDYNHADPKTRLAHANLVKSYMQCVDDISTHRDLSSGYASEPMLSEAAARLLNQGPHESIMHHAPLILAEALQGGLLAKGERGELVARTLLTIAHDRAILENPIMYPVSPSEPCFHRPMRLLDLLKNLLSKQVWEIVRAALPVHAYPDSKPLHTAFKDAWVNFSHF
ncbi:MAG TPA: hypothetical protein VGO47_10695, partial [Chlamydiales bacterium]|nr:hypothetical protein [Chlamydiales bacterium]